jgi:hypothetical protein
VSTYPTSNPAWASPVVRTLKFSTGIAQGVNGTEQRWMLSTGVESWSLPYPHLSVAQRDTLLTLFESSQGGYDQSVSLTFSGTTYTGLYFDADSLEFTESDPNVVAGTVKLTTVVRVADAGTMPGDFPVLGTGARMQRPYTYGRNFDTASVRTEGGRYAYPRRAASLRSWTVGGAVLTDTEAAAIWSMFKLACGQWRSFGFTDPDSSTRYANCRFGADSLDWRILGPNQNSIVGTIQQLV